MYGDFSRDTFAADKRLSRVLLQQGRVLLDADWNEQTAILLHYLRTLAADILGPAAGPGDSFKIVIKSEARQAMLSIDAGHYYVDGILCENDLAVGADGSAAALDYYNQEYPTPDLPAPPFLVYLDVWERTITAAEDDTIREVALGGADTAARAKVVWQAKVTDTKPAGVADFPADPAAAERDWAQWVEQWQPRARGQLRARAGQAAGAELAAGVVPPDARYRGVENQLYRVEVHTGGPAWSDAADGAAVRPGATFKWSRENGAVVFPIRMLAGADDDQLATLAYPWRDDRSGLRADDWVEILDDDTVLGGRPGRLARVIAVEREGPRVRLRVPAGADELPAYTEDSSKHPLLRRWDYRAGDSNRGGLTLAADGAATIVEGQGDHGWLALEDGIQIQFQDAGVTYRTGDYWLIPARTATGGVEWPGAPDRPEPREPRGVEHHYAPLATILRQDGKLQVADLRRTFEGYGKAATG
ncbi:MAG TPA: DUF6519 domain-containing protein [Thermomicrobiales bacterium]|nr:DUF6519 domain-containing protein [Thermomicrobiales bacterium]